MISWLRDELARRRARRRFATYVNPKPVEHLAANPDLDELGAKDRLITVAMSGARGFAATTSARGAVETLANTLELRVEILRRHGCFLFQLAGDVVFSGNNVVGFQPDHALRAVRAAEEIRAAWAGRGPGVQMVIAISTGVATVGDVGARVASNFTAIGPPVNDVRRMAKMAAKGPVRILLSEATANSVRDEYEVVAVEEVEIEGREERLKVFELGGRKKL